MAHINRLSALKVSKVKRPGRYADGGNLYLLVSPTGNKTWTFKYMLNGKGREMGLGAISDVSLEEARDAAREYRKMKREHIDPLTERKRKLAKKRKDIIFNDAAEAFIAGNSAAWSSTKSPQQWRNTIRDYATPVIGNLLIRDIDSADVLKCLNPIWHTKTETAKRLRGRIEKILDWAKVHGYREGENPAQWKGKLEHSLASPSKFKEVEHLASMPYAAIPNFIQMLEARDGIAASAVLFAILTAARSGEVRGAVWSEMDLDSALWVIPKDRMKNGKQHRVPLSAAALEVLQEMADIRHSDYVFPSSKPKRPLTDQGLTTVLRRMDVEKQDASIHGFRSSFRVWA
ncbi:MAG: tyrosine-type recombinase/integrase, partial [Pseudomonadales bacterium]